MEIAEKTMVDIFAVFFDEGVFTPLFAAPQRQVQAAFGLVGGQGAYAICQNGGVLAAADVKLCCKTLKLAAKTGSPVVTFYNAKGSLLTEGLESLVAANKLNTAVAQISGVVPQVAVITGVCGASNAMAAASADVCIMAKEAQLFLTPPFVAAAQGDTLKQAGSASFALKAGVAAIVAEDVQQAVSQAAKLLMLLPPNNLSEAAMFAYSLPQQTSDASNMGAQAAAALADEASLVELYAGFGSGAATLLGTLAGAVVGFVATAGADAYLGGHCVAKIARFVRMCDAFNIPLVTLINTAGLEKSSTQDQAGNLRLAARLAATYADATTAKVAVLSGNVVGTAYTMMGNADITIAVQGAVIAPAAPQAVVSVLYKDEIAASEAGMQQETQTRAQQYKQEQASAQAALQAGLADMLADSETLRGTLEAALDILATKRTQRMPKKHGNMAL